MLVNVVLLYISFVKADTLVGSWDLKNYESQSAFKTTKWNSPIVGRFDYVACYTAFVVISAILFILSES